MQQVKVGKVISNKMSKTVVVEIAIAVKHPLYKKRIKRTRKFKAHDDLGAQVGDKVKISETRPISKGIHFKTLEVVK